MIYKAGCFENTPKKREQATFSGRKVRKMEKEKKETQEMGPHKKWGQAPFSKLGKTCGLGKKWSLAPFFVQTEKVACCLCSVIR